MKKERIKGYKKTLINRMAASVHHRQREGLLQVYDATDRVSDITDIASLEMLRSQISLIADKWTRSMQEMHDALDRIHQGTFGYCQDCGQPIPEKRLAVYPTTKLCFQCAQKRERLCGRMV